MGRELAFYSLATALECVQCVEYRSRDQRNGPISIAKRLVDLHAYTVTVQRSLNTSSIDAEKQDIVAFVNIHTQTTEVK